jgi:hypothetical protein
MTYCCPFFTNRIDLPLKARPGRTEDLRTTKEAPEIKKGRFSEEQIIGILKQHEAARKVADVAREHRISKATIYIWKSKYGGLEVNEAQL